MRKKTISLLLCLSLIIITICTPNVQVHASWLPSLQVHFIDVGQADSILLKSSSDKTMLVDAGSSHSFKKIDNHLQKEGVEEIDVLIATHPHHDHIGSMDKIIKKYNVNTLIMPDIEYKTKYFKDLQEIIKEQNIVVQYPKDGMKFRLGFGVKVEILGPIKSKYKEINDYSSILRVVHGKNKFLLMGDAGKKAEQHLIDKYPKKLESDLLKVGHHGANTGTTLKFLKKVKPKYGIISVGKKNKYGYPSKEVLDRLEEEEIEIYRTDRLGTIVVNSDGKSINVTLNQ
jgi:competence protein ComEC